jgi:DNA-binding response OmpR family regulator
MELINTVMHPVAQNGDAMHNQRGLRVLVVEDDRPTAETLALILRQDGHEVGVAADGPTALEEAKARKPELIFVDIRLPGMDGYVVVKRIREQSSGRRPLLVALTGLTDQESRRRSQEAGIDLHLIKPVGADMLRGMLRRIQSFVGGIDETNPSA